MEGKNCVQKFERNSSFFNNTTTAHMKVDICILRTAWNSFNKIIP